ncbi:hypothetical protein SUGI_0858700 [Cryptomeria japonica]|nr:hypothetical protein SUGI_0858700 [Cryptomeria japonica]
MLDVAANFLKFSISPPRSVFLSPRGGRGGEIAVPWGSNCGPNKGCEGESNEFVRLVGAFEGEASNVKAAGDGQLGF